MKKRVLIKFLSWTVIALVAALFIRALIRDWGNVQDTLATISWTSWLSVLFFVAAVVVSGALWGRLVEQMGGKQVDKTSSIRIHAASWLLKYVPGQVGSLVNKIAWAKKYNYGKKMVATSVVYENILMVFASIVLSIPLLVFVGDRLFQDTAILLALIAIIPMFLVCNQRIFYTIINALLRLAKRKPIGSESILSSRQIASNTVLYLIPRVLNGVGFVVIAAAIFTVTPNMYIPLASSYIFASIVGMLAVFVPSGLGVREGIIVLLVGPYFSPEQAIILALIARFFSTIADIGVLVVYMTLNRGRIVQK